MTGAHWLILAAFAVAAVLRLWWTRRRPRIRGVDAESGRVDEQPKSFAQHCDDALDVIAADKDLVMDIVEAFGHEQAKAKHTDRAMRRLTDDYKCGTDGPCIHTGHDHMTPEEAADCTLCSPSSLPRHIEGGGSHGGELERAAFAYVADWLAECMDCGRPHEWRERGADVPGTWADPDDGHAYHARDRRVAAKIRRHIAEEGT